MQEESISQKGCSYIFIVRGKNQRRNSAATNLTWWNGMELCTTLWKATGDIEQSKLNFGLQLQNPYMILNLDLKMLISHAPPKLWYALAKIFSEKAAWEFAKENNIDLVTVLPSFVIGPSLPHELCVTASDILGLLQGI